MIACNSRTHPKAAKLKAWLQRNFPESTPINKPTQSSSTPRSHCRQVWPHRAMLVTKFSPPSQQFDILAALGWQTASNCLLFQRGREAKQNQLSQLSDTQSVDVDQRLANIVVVLATVRWHADGYVCMFLCLYIGIFVASNLC